LIGKIIDAGARIDQPDNMLGKNALMVACTHGNLNAVKMLILKGANVHQIDFYGYTPLMYASTCGSLVIVKELCKHMNRYGIWYKEPFGYNAIKLAESYEEYEIVDYLLNYVPSNTKNIWC
jgi:ankyrin repeat protein